MPKTLLVRQGKKSGLNLINVLLTVEEVRKPENLIPDLQRERAAAGSRLPGKNLNTSGNRGGEEVTENSAALRAFGSKRYLV